MKMYYKILFLFLLKASSFQQENHYKKYFENISFNISEISAPTFKNYTINIFQCIRGW